jgi:hypothetical protein
MRVRQDAAPGTSGSLLVFRRRDTAPETIAKGQELRGLLGLALDAEDFTLVFGAIAQNDREIAVVTRSVLHILMAMSMGVDVPETDVQEGRAVPGLATDAVQGRLVHVHCSDAAPGDAYVVVEYRDRWFWIDDRDLRSKRAFALMMMLFTISDPSSAENAPVVTIPA